MSHILSIDRFLVNVVVFYLYIVNGFESPKGQKDGTEKIYTTNIEFSFTLRKTKKIRLLEEAHNSLSQT